MTSVCDEIPRAPPRRARAPSPSEEHRLGFVIIRMGVDEYGEPLSNTHSHTDEMISDDTFLRVLCPRPCGE